RLRLWMGGQGEKRVLRLVARHAEGWNVPFLAPEIFAQRNATLDRWCEREGRDPRAITRTVNLGLALGRDEAQVRRQEERLRLMFGPMTDFVRPGILVGTPPQVIERIREYAAAAAGRTIRLRVPRFVVPPRSDLEGCTFVRLPMRKTFNLGGSVIANVGINSTFTSHHFLIWAYEGTDLNAFPPKGQLVPSKACL